jgi:UDP-GlcNAc:undecaprenyl-phosphate GlcNAc-1-phosphate transferase
MTFILPWFGAGLAVSLAIVPLCRLVAIRFGYVARPREDRWHSRPTALFGGVAIAVPALVLGLASPHVGDIALPLGAGALIFIVGLTDDILSLKPSTKLIAEIALASVFALAGQTLHWTSLAGADMLLTLVWLVGVTNAFNLLDNMDGLCAGVTLIAGTALLAGIAGRPEAAAESRYLAGVLGATAGFLVYNAHPASIFMGDAGSLFLGLTLAAVTLTAGGPAHDRSRILSIIAAPLLVLLIPIFDTTLVTVSRLLSGRRVSRGGRDHSSHRLVAIGLSERSAVRVLWTLAAAAGAIGFGMQRFGGHDAWLLGAVFIIAMVLFAVFLAQVRVYDEPAQMPAGRVTPMLISFMHKRRVAEVLLDVCLIALAYYGAWRLRFEGPEWNAYTGSLTQSMPIAIATQLIALFVFGAYRGAWRYFGLMDGVAFGKAVVAGTLSLIAAIVFMFRLEGYSRGVFVIYAALAMLLLCGSRASFRLIAEFAHRRRRGLRVAIYGADEAAPLVLREVAANPDDHYQMIGFVDDNPATHRLRIHGYPVLGGTRRLVELIESGAVDVIVLGARVMDPASFDDIQEACRAREVTLLRFTVQLEPLVSTG